MSTPEAPARPSAPLTPSIPPTAPPAPIVFSAARDRSPLGWAALGVAMVVSALVLTGAWERVKTRPVERRIEITGSARRGITSDLAEWSATISTRDLDRTAAYRALQAQVATARAYLVAEGFSAEEIRSSAATFEELTETEVSMHGEIRTEKQIFRGYHTGESLTVRSTDVRKVERVSREITRLLEQGITITSSAPSYFYTRLGELKIEMLAEASKDARTRAEKMLGAAGGASIDKLISADMGVININPANSPAMAWDGNNDTTSLDKDIMTIVHASYTLR